MNDRSALLRQPTDSSASMPTWGLRELLFGIILYVVPLLIAAVFARVMNVGQLGILAANRPLLTAIGLVIFEGLRIAPVGLLAVVKARGSWQAVGFRGFDARLGCVLPVVYLFIAFSLSAIWGLVIRLMGWPTQQTIAPLFGDDLAALLIGFAAACIVAPIAEETFFRGFIIGGLRKRFGAVGALLISAVFFALLHPPLTIFPVIGALGLLLGFLFLQTGSLWPGIFLHATFNTIGFLAQFAIKG